MAGRIRSIEKSDDIKSNEKNSIQVDLKISGLRM
jgi:hypothetical protein